MLKAWQRRCISIGMLCFGSTAVIVLFPAAACILFLIDLWHDRRFPLLRAYILVAFYCLWELLGVSAAFLVWLITRFVHGASNNRFLSWNYALQRLWVQGFARAGLLLFSMTFRVEEGEYLPGERPIMLLVRHTSLADTILATYLMRVQRDFRLRYVMKRELLWDPCLDIVGNRLPNYFVDRTSADTRQEAEAIALLAENLQPGEGVILWPESTRFSPEKRIRALERLWDKGELGLLKIAEDMQYVLPPRLLGVLSLLERNPELDVFFCAHTGFENAASFKDFFGGAMIGREIRAKLWGYPSGEVPREREAQKKWLYENWRQVDDFVRSTKDIVACDSEQKDL
ncbi:MAG: Acyltransferase [Candidatus Hydrogenedentes bacterium ADurb.Bin179]|nr:MAG: Acyltransferase [Candidatus Hydrogenedentes bacterium ADurb.Bin179]